LIAPFITLIISTYAKNKVEGMAFFKGVDLILLLPMLSFFVIGNLKYIFSIIPAFWTYNLFNASLTNGNTAYYFIIGLTIYGILISILFLQFKKRIFDR
jgi:fluoroquinolone transport system permease protein